MQAFHEDLTGRQHINEVYKLSVDKLYDVLFTESQFMSDFMEQRGISGPPSHLKPISPPPALWWVSVSPACFCFVHADVVYHPWKKEETGNQTREIMYTISLSNPLAPKTSTVSETQVRTLIPGGGSVGESGLGM